jgi:amino acid adenylation domain-containing protein
VIETHSESIDAQKTRSAPVSFAQQRLWILHELYPDSHAYNTRTAYTVHGDLDLCALQSSLEEIVRRHEALRTTFELVDGELFGSVAPPGTVPVPVLDVSDLPAANRQEFLAERLHAEGVRAFDLRRGPLFRAAAFRVGSREHVLLLSMHHIVFDEASKTAFNLELRTIYAAYRGGTRHDLAELPIQYADFARWQREWMQREECAQQRNYWRAHLSGAPARIELPLDRPRPAIARFNGAIQTITFSTALSQRIHLLGHVHRTTLFMTMLAAFNVLLFRYTGQRDLVVASPLANRTRTELEPLIGFFVNTLALRVRLDGDSTFRDVLGQVRETAISAYDNQDVPFERVVAELHPERSLSGTPVVNVMFFVRHEIEPLELEGLQIQRFAIKSTAARFDLTMRITDTPGGLVCSLQHDTDLFDAPTIERMLAHFTALWESIVSSPESVDLPISTLPLLSENERRALVVDANETQKAYPADRTLPHLLAEQVRRTPDSIAVVCDEATLTYAQLDKESDRLAGELARHGIGHGERIGILLERSPSLVVALLGILKHRCAYVPLDPNYPQKRLEFIVRDARLAAIVTRPARAHEVLKTLATLRIDVDGGGSDPPGSSSLEITAGSADDVAYTSYTSGSTGVPNGVNISHRSLLNLLWAMRDRPGLTAEDTLVAVTTIAFDIAALELLLPLIVGARLVIATDQVVIDGAAILRLLDRVQATVMQATPVTWQLLIEAGWRGGAPRKILCGGEALSRRLAEQLLERADEVWNLYGPTETTIWSSAARVVHGDGAVLIGPPIANTQFYVLDASGELLPPGVPGELFIGGDGLALGYHDRADLERERFVRDPFGLDRTGRLYRTGDIVRARGSQFEFLGRRDEQIKLRGFRIELGEISAALLAQPDVADAAAIVVDDALRGPSIRAYVAPQRATSHPMPDWPAVLRAGIARSLPRYMLPEAIVVLAALPRTPNGKIDRQSLSLSEGFRAAFTVDAPASELEMQLIEIVKGLLGNPRIRLRDDLFAAGLHSVLAVRLMAQINQIFSAQLPLSVVFDNPTVAALARSIQSTATQTRSAQPAEPIVVLNAGGQETPFVFLHNDPYLDGAYCRRLAAALGPSQPFYAVAPHGMSGLPLMHSVAAMAMDYYERLKQVLPSGPYRIGGFCIGGTIAFELARLLRARGDTVEHLVIINRTAPARLTLPACEALVRRIGRNARLDARTRLILVNVALLPFAAERGFAAFRRFLRARLRYAVAEILRRSSAATGPMPQKEFFLAQRVAGATYHPSRHDGPITLIWSSTKELVALGDPMRGDPTVGWSAFATGVRVIPMSGNHMSPMRERVGELGAILADVFRADRAQV